MVTKLHRAALSYNEWKQKHDPGYKPWHWPEQNKLPTMVPDDIESVESESVSDQELEQDVIEDEQDNCSSEDNLDEVML